jgi:hypothetical protein
MARRYFSKAQTDGRYYTHHYTEETAEGLLEAKIENFFSTLWKRILKLFP